MLFNSVHFLAFFPVVTAIYFLAPHRWRWAWLLAASCYFYMAFIPAYVLILFFLILVDFIAGLAIDGSGGRKRKLYLILSLGANASILAFFKYYNFAIENIVALTRATSIPFAPRTLDIILPIGLSFHTFQSMSYTIEVYLGRQRAERHLGIYALYVLFWPQLVAGPIERPQNLLHQFREPRSFDVMRVHDGFELMLIGFGKKVLVADTLATTVNLVYGAPERHSGLALVLATYFFAFQIYCDFSGYSDIARGAARVMGFELMVNFDRPYIATSVSEFWRRWHISLSTWFRDYLYIPLGGSRASRARSAFNLVVVFLVSGLWHGANWTFLCWGAIHGVVLAASHLAGRGNWKERAPSTLFARAWRTLATFHIVLLSWVFFRADSVSQAWYVLGHFWSRNGATSWSSLPINARELVTAVGAILVLNLLDGYLAQRKGLGANDDTMSGGRGRSIRRAVLAGVALLVLFRLTDPSNGQQQFIYFQF